MGPKELDGSFYAVLGLFDDDVAIRKDWRMNKSEGNLQSIRLAYSWAKDMSENFGGYNTYGEVYRKIVGCNAVLDYIDDVAGEEEERNPRRSRHRFSCGRRTGIPFP